MTLATFALATAAVTAIALLCLAVASRRRVRTLEAEVRRLSALLQEALAEEAVPAAPAVAEPAVPLITDLSDTAGSDIPDRITPSRVVSVTLTGPMIKVLALAAGLHRALDGEHRMRLSYTFRRELKRQQRMRRRAAAARARHAAGELR